MSEPMTFEEFCLDLVGTCQHCDGTGRAARPLSTELRGCEVCNGRLCHEALEIPIARRLFAHLASTGVDVGAVLRGEATLAPSALETLLRDLRYLAAPKVTGMGANLESEHELASAKRLPSVVRWAEQMLRVLSNEGKG